MHRSTVCLVTGGQRSGKSAFAQQAALALARSRGERPVYLATAAVRDGEFAARVERHRRDRGDAWDLLECPGDICHPGLAGRVGVVDCLTLWLAALGEIHAGNPDSWMEAVDSRLSALENLGATLYVVTNEINMGLHGLDAATREFQDVQGWTNQRAARIAGSVVLMVSGLPLWIKKTSEEN